MVCSYSDLNSSLRSASAARIFSVSAAERAGRDGGAVEAAAEAGLAEPGTGEPGTGEPVTGELDTDPPANNAPDDDALGECEPDVVEPVAVDPAAVPAPRRVDGAFDAFFGEAVLAAVDAAALFFAPPVADPALAAVDVVAFVDTVRAALVGAGVVFFASVFFASAFFASAFFASAFFASAFFASAFFASAFFASAFFADAVAGVVAPAGVLADAADFVAVAAAVLDVRVDLAGVDSAGVDLADVDLVDVDLLDVDLADADLADADLADADLADADFVDLGLARVDSARVDSARVDSDGVDLADAIWDASAPVEALGALTGVAFAALAGVLLVGATFAPSDLAGVALVVLVALPGAAPLDFATGPSTAVPLLADAVLFLADAVSAADASVVTDTATCDFLAAAALAPAGAGSFIGAATGVTRTSVMSLVACAGIDSFGAFRTAPVDSAIAIPPTRKTGARPIAAHSKGGKNTERRLPGQTCHTFLPY